jgi:hypothetical protein
MKKPFLLEIYHKDYFDIIIFCYFYLLLAQTFTYRLSTVSHTKMTKKPKVFQQSFGKENFK